MLGDCGGTAIVLANRRASCSDVALKSAGESGRPGIATSDRPEDREGCSLGFGAGSGAHLGMPALGVGEVVRDRELHPAREIDRHHGGDVGNAEGRAGDELVVG